MSDPMSDPIQTPAATSGRSPATSGLTDGPAHAIPSYGTPAAPGTPTPPAPLTASDERLWGTVAHLSGFVAAYVALGFLGPLVVMLTVGNRSAFVRRHAVEALNFNLSVLAYLAVSALLVVVLVGVPMLIAVGVLYVLATVSGAIAANRGEEYRYPLTFRLVS
jgi:uncharacterized Tic20 family protein